MEFNFFVRFLGKLNGFKVIPNIVLFTSLCFGAKSFALPDVNQIANGDIKIDAQANSLQINQNTEKAIINWNSFNISAQESVHFQQPANSICVNRIDPSNSMSQIHGNLNATGTIVLINQAGVLFGETARLNVGGLVASTIDIADKNFADDLLIFDQSTTLSGSIINRGEIKIAEEGFAALLGASVSQEGMILTKLSTIALTSGSKFAVDFHGNGIISYAVEPTTAAGLDEKGNKLSNAINVSGKIINEGGAVYLSTNVMQNVFDNLINMSGVVRANSITQENGFILLHNVDNGVLKITGELDTSGIEKDTRGGEIFVLGEQIRLEQEAKINVSGDSGEGTMVIGGFYDRHLQSKPTNNINIGPNVVLNADAKIAGHGGKIIVLADLEATFLGKASARGGATSGDGGTVTIVSRKSVSYDKTTANIDTSSTTDAHPPIIIEPHAVISTGDPMMQKFISKKNN